MKFQNVSYTIHNTRIHKKYRILTSIQIVIVKSIVTSIQILS